MLLQYLSIKKERKKERVSGEEGVKKGGVVNLGYIELKSSALMVVKMGNSPPL